MVVYVATVAERVDLAEGISKRSGGAQNVAIGVIFILCNDCTSSVHDGHYVTLQVGDVIVGHAVVAQCVRLSTCGIEEVQRGIAVGFSQEFSTGAHISVLPL